MHGGTESRARQKLECGSPSLISYFSQVGVRWATGTSVVVDFFPVSTHLVALADILSSDGEVWQQVFPDSFQPKHLSAPSFCWESTGVL